jgi:hypothetical protein
MQILPRYHTILAALASSKKSEHRRADKRALDRKHVWKGTPPCRSEHTDNAVPPDAARAVTGFGHGDDIDDQQSKNARYSSGLAAYGKPASRRISHGAEYCKASATRH